MKDFKLYTTVGIIETDDYWDNDKYVLHREDGPAFIEYYYSGSIFWEEWYINGVKHREDGPAFIEYNNDGSIFCEIWYWCGMQHRHDYTLPAVIYDGEYVYWWYGVECTQKQLLDRKFRDRIALQVLG